MDNRSDRDGASGGVRVTAHPRRRRRGRWLAALAGVALLAGVGWFFARPAHVEDSPWTAHAAQGDDAPVARSGAVPTPSSVGVAAVQPRAAGSTPAKDGEDPTLDLSDYVLPGEAPDMAQVIDALHARGIRTGLGAFQPPGTKPALRGLQVPDGFALPEGYVRHFQATDDGQRIAPILMFAPDVDWVTVRGVRVPVPGDRVVPPSMAPPGMPLQWVSIPAPIDPRGRG